MKAIIIEHSASPKGKAKLFARHYRRLALVLIDEEVLPKEGREEHVMLSPRAKGVLAVIESSVVHKGRGTGQSEYAAYLAELRAKRDSYNTTRNYANAS